MAALTAVQRLDPMTTAFRALRWGTAMYLVGWLLHSADHLRRGTDVVTRHVQGLGVFGTIVAFVIAALVFTRHRWAPIFATYVVLPTGVLLIAVHVLPSWGVWSDAFPGGATRGVTAMSWVAVLLEVSGKLAVGLIGVSMLLREKRPQIAAG